MTIGEKIINAIIEGNLVASQCAHDDRHGCVIVWSSGAAEQLEALVKDLTNESFNEGYAAAEKDKPD